MRRLLWGNNLARSSNNPLVEAQLQLKLLQEELALSSRGMAALALELENKAVALDETNKQLQQEIAEHRQAVEALKKSEAKYESLYNSAPVAYFSVDTNALIRRANKAAEALLGYTFEEFRKMTVFDLYAEESKTKARELFGEFKRGNSLENEEMVYNRKDGQEVHGLLSVNPIKDEEGQVLKSRSVVVDITGHKKAQKAQRELEAQKLVVDKLKELESAKDEFISTVTHELRTPMTPLRSTIEMLLDGSLGELTDRQEKFIRMMGRNVERLAQFTTEVLTLSRLESGRFKLDMKRLSLHEALASVLELMKQKAQSKKSTVSFNIDAEITAYADVNSLGIIVTNLVNNAIVHNSEGTAVSVSAHKLDAGLVEVSIADDGQGIPEESLENLFDRFYQAKREDGPGYQGTGVGLAVCKALVEAMDGKISGESHIGEGTVFRFTLPAQEKKGTEE